MKLPIFWLNNSQTLNCSQMLNFWDISTIARLCACMVIRRAPTGHSAVLTIKCVMHYVKHDAVLWWLFSFIAVRFFSWFVHWATLSRHCAHKENMLLVWRGAALGWFVGLYCRNIFSQFWIVLIRLFKVCHFWGMNRVILQPAELLFLWILLYLNIV